MSDPEPATFASVEQERDYWKEQAAKYQQRAEEAQEELQEFQQMSRDYEAELETELKQCDARYRELLMANNRLRMELENYKSLKNLLESVQRLKDEARDLRQELAVQQKPERKSSISLSKDVEKPEATPSRPSSVVTSALPSLHATPSRPPGSGSAFNTPSASYSRIEGLTGTPLTTSARISALNIVGELLRKVGNLESKLASCRELHVHEKTPSRAAIGQGTLSVSREAPEIPSNTNGLYDKGMVKRLDFGTGPKIML
ncbi:nuclear distribution protein nudE homolog 1-A-like [Sinocyclocheilus rhinocerous]|uniref:nuclear distribution protein nudE homolog 1-A-like n=1 Tax=Sinocyclocheilus rhinocerous TaxID=307959 RepID=UPI0007B84B37|nr:PREDICTED: nuclear distribution protein nudE homolog 1-A-like [Sinocyclocheilus rhinocerous]